MVGQQSVSLKYHPQPKSQKTRDLHQQSEKGTAKFHGSKSCGNNTNCGSDKGVALARGGWGGADAKARQCVAAVLPITRRKSCGEQRPSRSRAVPGATVTNLRRAGHGHTQQQLSLQQKWRWVDIHDEAALLNVRRRQRRNGFWCN